MERFRKLEDYRDDILELHYDSQLEIMKELIKRYGYDDFDLKIISQLNKIKSGVIYEELQDYVYEIIYDYLNYIDNGISRILMGCDTNASINCSRISVRFSQFSGYYGISLGLVDLYDLFGICLNKECNGKCEKDGDVFCTSECKSKYFKGVQKELDVFINYIDECSERYHKIKGEAYINKGFYDIKEEDIEFVDDINCFKEHVEFISDNMNILKLKINEII